MNHDPGDVDGDGLEEQRRARPLHGQGWNQEQRIGRTNKDGFGALDAGDACSGARCATSGIAVPGGALVVKMPPNRANGILWTRATQ
jgi:hypothetical protein